MCKNLIEIFACKVSENYLPTDLFRIECVEREQYKENSGNTFRDKRLTGISEKWNVNSSTRFI